MTRLFKVISKTDCGFCKRAIAILRRNSEQFVVQIMDYAPEELSKIADEVGQNTVPIIFNDETFIGGFTELESLFKKEKEAKKAADKYEKNK